MKNYNTFESKDSKEKELKDEDTSRSNIFKKFMYALSFMTIEPMMVLQGIASNIVMVPEDQMVLYKICRGIFVIHKSKLATYTQYVEHKLTFSQRTSLIFRLNSVKIQRITEIQLLMILLRMRYEDIDQASLKLNINGFNSRWLVSKQYALGRSTLFPSFCPSTSVVGAITTEENPFWLFA